jgi:hypothetical protein
MGTDADAAVFQVRGHFFRHLEQNAKPITVTNHCNLYARLVAGTLNDMHVSNVIQQFYTARPIRTIFDANEMVLQTIFELACWGDGRCLSEVCLLDPSKGYGHGRYRFIDLLFVGVTGKDDKHDNVVPIVELKNISLRGLWKATPQGSHDPTTQDKEKLKEEILGESEEELLARRFHHWDAKQKAWTQTCQTVAQLKASALQQVRDYGLILRNGHATNESSGIFDRRIKCQEGKDNIVGYVCICVGVRVVFWQAIGCQTKVAFRRNTECMNNLGLLG